MWHFIPRFSGTVYVEVLNYSIIDLLIKDTFWLTQIKAFISFCADLCYCHKVMEEKAGCNINAQSIFSRYCNLAFNFLVRSINDFIKTADG